MFIMSSDLSTVGSVSGDTNEIQFNYGGNLGAESGLTYDIDTNILSTDTITADIISTDEIGIPTGTLLIGGYSQTNNENLTIDFETTSNYVAINSTSGAGVRYNNELQINSDAEVQDNVSLGFGTSTDSRIEWTTTGNDNLQIGTRTNNPTYAGYISIMQEADIGNANRSPLTISNNPVLRIYSKDESKAQSFGQFTHDDTALYIDCGTGSEIRMSSDTGVRVMSTLSIDNQLIISASTVGTIGGQVGRIEILSSDGVTKCYIPIYAGS